MSSYNKSSEYRTGAIVINGYIILIMLRGLRFLYSAKKIVTGSECTQVITDTASEIARVAAVTLGPMGRNVIIENDKHLPRITKDGVTVVKHIEYEDRLQDAVCTLIKKSVNGTNKFAGDGTTTSTLLIGALLKQARKMLVAGYTSRQIKQGLLIGRNLALDFLEVAAQPVSTQQDFFRVAMIATKGDRHISELISQAVSKSELIKVQKTQKTQSYLEYLQGVRIVAGIPHPEFKNVGDKVELDYPLVLIDKKGISSIEDIVAALELAKRVRKQLFVISYKISDSVMSNFIYNRRKKIVQAYPLVLQSYGSVPEQYIKQLSKSTGATVFDQYGPCSLQEIQYEHLGKAVRVQMDEFETIVYGKADQTISNAVIYAGGSTEAVTLEIYDKVIDALNSVKTAKKRGVIAGSGVTYWKMADMLQSYEGPNSIGVKILAKALREPRRQLVKNIPNHYMALRGSGWQGYNFKSGKLEDMFEAGIVDSAVVGESVLLDSVSLAHMLLDIEVAVMRADRNSETTAEAEMIQRQYRL